MYILGIDIGSTTSKAVIMNDKKEIVASSIVVATVGTDGVSLALEEVLNQSGLNASDISCTVATGYGRQTYEGADYQVSELSCHALGVNYIFPDARTVIDIGGQDAKVLSLNESGRMVNFIMNDKCAAGTGRFLDVMANILKLDISELESEARKAAKPASISSTCTVFAESEVISQLAAGTSIPDLVAGICQSVATRVASQAKRIGVKERVCMSGGVAKNGGVRDALSKELGVEIAYSDKAQLMGALGAALYAFDKINK
ncbi:MAG: acyl-CoA dehydratase activase [Eubacteriales bacterium]|nr:acyl-CoA dehydratase activase [Eubacteriales bacterium]